MKALRISVLMACWLLAGCSAVGLFAPEGPPYYEDIYAGYRQVQLKTSDSADVLTTLGKAPNELISQSKSVIAAAGQRRKGYENWCNMVAFDQDTLIAKRKYVLIADERPKALFVEPWEGMSFDCEVVLDGAILSKPYASENARRVAILKRISEDMRKDVGEVATDNKMLEVDGVIVNQAFAAVLTDLDSSPVLASKLTESQGLAFKHTSFNKGLIWMTVEGDVATIRIQLGSTAKKLKVSFERSPKS